MLSVKAITVEEAASKAQYFAQNTRESYYLEGGEPPGNWVGNGSEWMGLNGPIHEDQLNNLFQGYHPDTGKELVTNAGANHKPGWDCTFSAPKSVSATWAVAEPDLREAISKAQAQAVQAGLDFIEEHALYNRFGAGSHEKIHVAGAITATFEHATSRNGDPQLHTHAIIANVAVSQEGQLRCIDLDTRWKRSAGAVYRAELAQELQNLGFQVQKDGNYFKVEGVPETLTDQWSSRRKEVLEFSEKAGLPPGQGSEWAALLSRQAKKEVDRKELWPKWQQEAEEHAFTKEQIHAMQGLPELAPEPPKPEVVLESLMNQQSTFTEPQLFAEVAIHGQGSLNKEQIHQMVEQIKQSTECVPLISREGVNRFTTREMLELERNMVQKAEQLAGNTQHQIKLEEVRRYFANLGADQRMALEHLTAHSGQVASVNGMAGTGKSYLLGQAGHIWEDQGLLVRGAALSGKAAQGLEQESQIPSQTLHSLFKDLDKGRLQLDASTILVVDEAGMVGSRRMARLVDEAEASGAKLVLIGDVKQLQPIEAGQAFGAISKQVGTVELAEIRRQKDERDRQIVKDFSEGRAEQALKGLMQNERFHLKSNALECMKQAADASIADRLDGKSSVVLAQTNFEVQTLNEMARNKAQREGLVSKAQVDLETDQGFRSFSQGDSVVFRRNHHGLGVKNGTLGKVKEVAENGLNIEDGQGKVHWINFKHYNFIDHGYALTAHKAQGATFDRAHVLLGEFSGKEWSYVAASRAREATHLYVTKEVAGLVTKSPNMALAVTNLAVKMARSLQKQTSLDYSNG